MKKYYLLITVCTIFLIAVGVLCYMAGSVSTGDEVKEATAFPMPFSLGGAGILLGIVKWFISKILLVIGTIIKLVLAFILIMAVGMGVTCLF